ncbi:MAG TPA: HIT family protein, partial [Candidatus Paceibacterota bacterium]|nr:HIT family protein [Candidatus Paceibacterota bacterium]
KGHTLIVPKAPCPDIESIDAPMAAAVLMAAKKITKALRKVYGYDGIILHEVNGEKAQDVMQFHMHVYGTLPPGAGHFYRSLPQDPAEKKAVLASIAQELSTAVADIG